MVLSAVSCLHQLSCVDSSVTGYSLIRGGCDSSIGSVGRASASVKSVLIKCFGFVAPSVTGYAANNNTGRAQGFLKKCDLSQRVSISVHHLSVTTSVLVDAVSSLVSVSIWCRQWWAGCRCKLWPASLCLWLVSQNG